MKIFFIHVSSILFFFSVLVVAKENADLIVAKDGSGNFKTIQEAINATPANAIKPFVILIKNGTYNEKLFIEKNFITLVGEDKDSTRIIFPELRRNWLKVHPGNDYGSAVINIGNSVSDLTIANLTVYNNYGSTHSNEKNANDHQFAIRGGGDKVMILNCIIKADGGDTLSLWNKISGKYYHAFCNFEGYVDYVCPRGWCYITDSKFFGHNLTASIWHDGSFDKDQKFVIKNSYFDGVKNFPLGRNNRDGQFYLLDCKFSSNMADKPIYLPSADSTYKWGKRYYFYNCHRDGGDFLWFKNNLNEAPGSTKPEDITAEWTFAGKWNPEANLPSVLPFAFFPAPRYESQNNSIKNLKLVWVPGRNAVTHKIYFGETKELKLVSSQKENFYKPKKLKANKTYYWRVDEVADNGIVKGYEWRFKTGQE